MLSRLAFRQASLLPVAATRVLPASSNQSTQSSPPRPVRPEYPSPVRHGFIPEEWFTFFYNKTGVTGPYVLTATLGTYLFSKELYVCDHEFYNGLSILMIWVVFTKKFGPKLAAYLDKEIDDYEASWEQSRINRIKSYEDIIEDEKKEQLRAGVQQLIMDVKKENIKMQLEAVYRERMIRVYTEVKKRLDYQVQIQNIERRIAHKHMAQWIINNVLKAITPDQEKATLKQCIKDLQGLAAMAKA